MSSLLLSVPRHVYHAALRTTDLDGFAIIT